MMRKIKLIISFLLTLTIIVLASCSNSNNPTTTTTKAPETTTTNPVTTTQEPVTTTTAPVDTTTQDPATTTTAPVATTTTTTTTTTEAKLVVSFDANNGSSVTSVEVEKGGKITEPTAPTKASTEDYEYSFAGWYSDKELKNKYDFNSEINSNLELYAKWNQRKAKFTIFLAGDSTVKTYVDNQYIAGWGQYLNLFLDDSITVKNCAQGGRSSRSFINEGRLYDNEGATYKFSENGGNSIGDEIQAGDYLFIQFGHNDDATKVGNTLADRMVPLGEPDANGIYPTTPGVKTNVVLDNGVATLDSVSLEVQTLMASYQTELNKYLKDSVSKYGPSYYEYSSGGTYKWFLKQYIDFAREKGATPVLVTPVARKSFDGSGNIKGGPGLHGDDFAYVKAVRQLAEEEGCLLIDLFNETKTFLETATPSYANFLMALVPNDVYNGPWPSGYDTTYDNSELGFDKIESTHYNKFGAFLTSAKVAENLKALSSTTTKTGEAFEYAHKVLAKPEQYVSQSNLITKAKVESLFNLFETVNPKDPEYTYPDPKVVEDLITALVNKYETITEDNYLEAKEECKEVRLKFTLINVDDINNVSNVNDLTNLEARIKEMEDSLRPDPTQIILISMSDLGDAGEYTTTQEYTSNGMTFKVVAASGKKVTVGAKNSSVKYNDVTYESTKYLDLGGMVTFSSSRYIEFTLTSKANVTVYASGGTLDDGTDRYLRMVNTTDNKTNVATFAAPANQTLTTVTDIPAGTYQLGSYNKGARIYLIIIEYFE